MGAVPPQGQLVSCPNGKIRVGAGLTRLGRPWGVTRAPVPTEHEARVFLETAMSLGVDIFDTAPSYGESESRLGHFLAALGTAERARAFVATKFGEAWDGASDEIVVDHSYAALARSLERSLDRLGHIDLIQLHRSTADALCSAEVRRAFALARTLGVPAIGASVSRVEDARVALETLGVEWLQFPYHVGNAYMEPAFALAIEHGARVLVNRPFGMGAIVQQGEGGFPESAFRFILGQRFCGAILTGTASPAHLRENVAAFARSVGDNDAPESE